MKGLASLSSQGATKCARVLITLVADLSEHPTHTYPRNKEKADNPSAVLRVRPYFSRVFEGMGEDYLYPGISLIDCLLVRVLRG
jgi:hypothetical protein